MRVRRPPDAQRPPAGHTGLSGLNLAATFLDAWRLRRGPSALHDARRQARLARLIAFARAHSPFYAALYADLPDAVGDLRILPPVAKRELMERFDEWVTDPGVTRESVDAFVADPARIGELYLGRYVVFATSGTTGMPGIFLQDKDAMTVYAALLAARRLPSLASAGAWRPFLGQGGRTATVITVGGHFTSSVIERLVRRRYPLISGRNKVFSILEPLPELVRSLNAFRPAVVGSYPTALSVLAREQEAGRLAIRPALALTGAEWLSPAARERIAAAFGCPVRDTYAASEFMGIAFDCRHGRLHVNSDWAVLEAVDEEYRPAPPGTASRTTLLTNLANRVQPILRYDLGDSVTMLPSPCPCGSGLPAIQVEGRRDEVLSFSGPGGETVPILPMAIATAVEETPWVRAWQAVQCGPALLALRIEEAAGHDRRQVAEAAAGRVRALLAAQGLAWVTVEATCEPPRRDPVGGKLRQVFADLNPPR